MLFSQSERAVIKCEKVDISLSIVKRGDISVSKKGVS